MKSLSDEELMRETGQGNAEAFSILADRYSHALIQFFYRHTWSYALSEDLAQDCLIRIYNAAGAYLPRARFTTWMYRVARNLWIDYLRKTQHERGNVRLDITDEGGRSLVDRIAARQLSPEEYHSRAELAGELVNAIDQLSEEHKSVFILSVLHDMRYAEISDILDIPVGTVKSRMFHAINKLRSILKGTQIDPTRMKSTDE